MGEDRPSPFKPFVPNQLVPFTFRHSRLEVHLWLPRYRRPLLAIFSATLAFIFLEAE